MNTKTAIVLTSLATAAVAPAWGNILVDNFNAPPVGGQKIVIIPPAPGFAPPAALPGPNPSPLYDGPHPLDILGSYRRLDLHITAPPPPAVFPVSNTAEMNVESTFLNYSTDPFVNAIARVTWDANSAGLGPIDLLAQGGVSFLVDVAYVDGAGSTIRMGIKSGGSDYWSPPTALGNTIIPFTETFLFSSFSDPTKFNSVDAIYLEIDGITAADLVFDNVSVAVPEASPMVALGALAGLVGVWQYRRSRKTA